MQTAGVYEYTNTYHNKYYVGQSTNLTGRLAEHPSDLAHNKHRNSAFQYDYNDLLAKNLNPHNYIQVKILYKIQIEKKLSAKQASFLKKTLQNKEQARIKELQNNGVGLYNYSNNFRPAILKKPTFIKGSAPNAVPVVIFDTFYPSIFQASQFLGVTSETVRKRIKDPKNKDWLYSKKQIENKPKRWN